MKAHAGVEHYENFPVASWLCPPRLRPAVVAIYHFARTADDIADEGDAPAAQRQADLAEYRAALDAALAGRDPGARWREVFVPLAAAARAFALPAAPLHALLDAFVQDTHEPLYADRSELLDYCRRSADPVGRLLLHLYGVADADALARSDAVCSALQLINFWQDLSRDVPRGRHYVPEADLLVHGLTRDELVQGPDTAATRALVRSLCAWAATLMRRGAPLALRVPGRAGWELRLVVQGGLRILEKIERMDHAVLSRRPALRAWDLPLLLWRALRMGARAPSLA
ncbi:MAG: squalene synthase HpnC [Rubrivivax sp.]|nr:squalene synthase HpnC [Rubrivivax sp.]